MPNLITVELGTKGKFFEPMVPMKVKKAISEGILEMATIEGQVDIQSQLFPSHGYITGNLHRHISTALISPLVAQVDAGKNRYGSNLIYASWVEGTSPRNARSRFKGYGMFKKTRKKLEGMSQTVIYKYIGDRIMRVFR